WTGRGSESRRHSDKGVQTGRLKPQVEASYEYEAQRQGLTAAALEAERRPMRFDPASWRKIQVLRFVSYIPGSSAALPGNSGRTLELPLLISRDRLR
ncbi:hypothetical protein TOPH_02195, partial [Tolypocladium ophioglossoides CBS 100239]